MPVMLLLVGLRGPESSHASHRRFAPSGPRLTYGPLARYDWSTGGGPTGTPAHQIKKNNKCNIRVQGTQKDKWNSRVRDNKRAHARAVEFMKWPLKYYVSYTENMIMKVTEIILCPPELQLSPWNWIIVFRNKRIRNSPLSLLNMRMHCAGTFIF